MLLQTRTRMVTRGATPRVSMPVGIVAGSLVLGFLSLVLPSAPTYDPFAWIIWGREITQLDLTTIDGPSWKPLPVIVTTITAPLGEASPYIWVAVGRAGAIAAAVLAGVLAARLAGWAAGVVAGVTLFLMPWWLRNGALGNSEGIMVALVVGGALCHLEGRRGWAFTLAIGAGLLRPEAWPFLGLYALYLLYEDRSRITWLAGGLLTLPVLWLGPEYWGSGNAFRASDRAQNPRSDSPAFADDPALEVVENAVALAPAAAFGFALVALALALAAVALAATRRGAHGAEDAGPPAVAERLPDRRHAIAILLLGLLAAAWIGLVALMTVRGFSGNTRYLMVPGSLIIVLGAAGAALAVRALAGRALPVVAAAVVAAGFAAVFVIPDADELRPTLREIEYQSDLYHDLGRLVDRAGGGDYLRECGHPFTGPFLVPQVAWKLGVHTHEVDLRPPPGERAVVFHVRHTAGGWVAPPYTRARPNELGREGHWRLTANCEAPR